MNPPFLYKSARADQTRVAVWLSLGLVLLVCATFWGTRSCDFVNLDDPLFVSENPHIRHGLTHDSWRWCWTADLTSDSPHADYWQPITFLVRASIISAFGLNPAMHHSVNLLLHIFNTLLVFHVLRRMTGAGGRCALIAALWAVHPQRVESVAWITELKDLLSGFFWWLAIWAYLRYAALPSLRRYLPVVLLFALALLSKPVAITLPAILLLLDAWPLRRAPLRFRAWRRWGTLLAEKLPMILMTLVIIGLTLRSQNGVFRAVAPINPLANALASCGIYLKKFLFPWPLYVPYAPFKASPDLSILLGWALLLGTITGITIVQRDRRPWLLLGWAWFLITLTPVLGLRDIATADRFTYIPAVGLIFPLVWLAEEGLRSRRHSFLIGFLLAFAVLLPLARLCHRQTNFWKDGIALFHHAVEQNPDNVLPQTNLAAALVQAGRPMEALPHLRMALAINPGHPNIHVCKGNALLLLGRPREARDCFLHALKISPQFADAYFPLGNLYLADGDIASAIDCYIKNLEGKPYHASARLNLGIALAAKGNLAEAMRQMEMALHLIPDYAEAHYNLGLLRIRNGETDRAIRHFEVALALRPQWTLPRIALDKLRKRPSLKSSDVKAPSSRKA